jgi:hypothetical protein
MRTLVLIMIFLASFQTFAEVREAPTMARALEGVDQDTLVIFDLDNTVMTPPQSLGGEEWYDYFVAKRTEEFKAQGLNEREAKEKAIDKGLKEWNQFHQNAKVIPVEIDTPSLINTIQLRGIQTMALTARPDSLGEATVTQLKSIGITMDKNPIVREDLTIDGTNPSKFYKGILLVGPKNNKGEVLAKFLQQLQLHPKKIIFVDNKQHHVIDVEKALVEMKTSYFGRRYGAADQKIACMNKQVVEIQHRYFFGDVLSNADAEKLLK